MEEPNGLGTLMLDDEIEVLRDRDVNYPKHTKGIVIQYISNVEIRKVQLRIPIGTYWP